MRTSNAIHISPSILAADFANLGRAVAEAERAGAHSIHIDYMDGHYVRNLTFGFDLLPALRQHTTLPLVAHLELENPDALVPDFARYGADVIVVCEDTCPDLPATLAAIRGYGAGVGVSLNPDRPLRFIEPYLEQIDLLLILSVFPGFGGQAFIPETPSKIKTARATLDRLGSAAALAVDGGINRENVAEIVQAGADILVVGSALFHGNLSENLRALQTLAA